MININNISLSFASRPIFKNVSWMIPEKSRIGLVGDNGTGKTTLFKAIMGMVDIDSGSIDIQNKKNRTTGYLPQDLVELEPLPLLDYLRKKSGITELEKAMNSLENQLSHCDADSFEYFEALKAYEYATLRFQASEGYRFEAKAAQILSGLGFREKDLSKNCADFSGGWKMRIMIALILLSAPDIMLLDEPTNHLDTESMEWLEDYLKNYPGTLLAIAHDRIFLDKTVNQIAELSNNVITVYKGNFSFYLMEKEKRKEALIKQMVLQRSEIKKTQEFVERFRYKATKAKQVQSRLKMLERFDIVEQEKAGRFVHIRFPEAPRSGKDVLSLKQVSKSYGDVNVLRSVNLNIYRGDKIALVGVNGAGKSTMARIISGQDEPSSGSVTYGLNVSSTFFSQESAVNLDYQRSVWDEVFLAGTRSDNQALRNILGAFLFSGDDIYKNISVLSGGEKSRLALIKILLQDSNFLILDEPTNHLDMKTKEIFQDALLKYEGTVVIVSHDRFFLDRLVNRVIEVRNNELYEYFGNYSYFIQKRIEMNESPAQLQDGLSSYKDKTEAIRVNRQTIEIIPRKKDIAAASYKIYKTKEEKRLQAEERNLFFRRTTVLRDGLKKFEESITLLEKKKKENEESLCEPNIYKEPQKIKRLNEELLYIAEELQKLYSGWQELTHKLESFEAENNLRSLQDSEKIIS